MSASRMQGGEILVVVCKGKKGKEGRRREREESKREGKRKDGIRRKWGSLNAFRPRPSLLLNLPSYVLLQCYLPSPLYQHNRRFRRKPLTADTGSKEAEVFSRVIHGGK